jgi:hypothetical protein
MGFDLGTFPPAETIKLLALYLDFVAKTNDKRIGNYQQVTRFRANGIPSIGILGYYNRILKYAPCSTESLLGSLIYIRRICFNQEYFYNPTQSSDEIEQLQAQLQGTKLSASTDDKIVMDSYNIHRLIITAVLIATKFLSDEFYTNLHVASIYD